MPQFAYVVKVNYTWWKSVFTSIYYHPSIYHSSLYEQVMRLILFYLELLFVVAHLTENIVVKKIFKLFIYFYIKYGFWKYNYWIVCLYYIFYTYQLNFKKITHQLLCLQINIKILYFYNLKLCIKNKFIN